jgi:signal transduction histidine kinase
VREAVDNLIENAVKYTPSGSITINVSADDTNILVSVTDTGIGIAPEDLGHIFQKFYRVDSSDTREIGGTGLGLYISKRRVEANGGRMWAESEYQKGSTFFISLPRLDSREVDRLKTLEVHRQALKQGVTEIFNPFGTTTSATAPSAGNAPTAESTAPPEPPKPIGV